VAAVDYRGNRLVGWDKQGNSDQVNPIENHV